MMQSTLRLVIAVKNTLLQTLARYRTKNDGMKTLGRVPVHTVHHAGPEPMHTNQSYAECGKPVLQVLLPVLVILVAQ